MKRLCLFEPSGRRNFKIAIPGVPGAGSGGRESFFSLKTLRISSSLQEAHRLLIGQNLQHALVSPSGHTEQKKKTETNRHERNITK